MARKAIDIVADAQRKIKKTVPIWAEVPVGCSMEYVLSLIAQENLPNNKSERIKMLAEAAGNILCEIERIQAIKGDGIVPPINHRNKKLL